VFNNVQENKLDKLETSNNQSFTRLSLGKKSVYDNTKEEDHISNILEK